jgi:hypothetical protein
MCVVLAVTTRSEQYGRGFSILSQAKLLVPHSATARGRSHTFEEATLPAGSEEEQTTVRTCQAKQ